MPYIQVGETSLFYTTHHIEPGRRDVVLIHGAGGSHLHWPAQLRRLEGANVYAIDLPAHGKSGGVGCASIGEYAAVLVGFLDALEIGPTVFAGHSMGWAIAQQLALEYPSRVAGLILVATGARLRVAPAILEGVLADYESALDAITAFAWGPQAPQDLVRLGRAQLAQVSPQVAHSDYSACNAFDVMERLGSINAPTLIVSGTADQLTPPKYAARLAEGIPGARLRLIEQAGHMVMLEQPQQVAQAVDEFLQML